MYDDAHSGRHLVPVYDHSPQVCQWVSNCLFGHPSAFPSGYGWGYANNAEGLVAGFVYHNFDPPSGVIELSAHSTRRNWNNKDRLRAVFSYPFDQLGVRIVVARNSEKNTRTLRIWRALGAELTSIPELRAPGEAEVIATLHRDTWHKSKFAR